MYVLESVYGCNEHVCIEMWRPKVKARVPSLTTLQYCMYKYIHMGHFTSCVLGLQAATHPHGFYMGSEIGTLVLTHWAIFPVTLFIFLKDN